MLSPGDTKYLFISPLKFNSFFFSLLFLKWRENGGKLWTFDLICKSVGWVWEALGIVLIIKNQQPEKKELAHCSVGADLHIIQMVFMQNLSIFPLCGSVKLSSHVDSGERSNIHRGSIIRCKIWIHDKKVEDWSLTLYAKIIRNITHDSSLCRRIERMGVLAAEETVPCSNCLQPNYMATNELPIMRIYCLVLSQELIKSTQLKAAMRKTSAVNRAFIQLIHDCQLK